MQTDPKKVETDLKTLKRLVERHEADLDRAQQSAKRLHAFLDRCAGRYGEDLGVDIQSVIPKDPD